jgi:hypothetical protein
MATLETTNRKEWENPSGQWMVDKDNVLVYAPSGNADNRTSQNPNGKSSRYTQNQKSITAFNRAASDAILEAAMLATLGRKPTAAEKRSFHTRLNAYLKANATISRTSGQTRGTSGTATTTTTQGADQDVFTKKYVNSILAAVLGASPEADLSGEAGQTQDTLNAYSNDMGLFKTRREVNSYVQDIVAGNKNVEDVVADMRKQAAVLYKNFADRLNADPKLTVRDLANPYLQMMSDILEIDPNNVNLTDNTIQGAIGGDGLMSLGDFRSALRRDSRYGSTYGAKREAADMASGFLRAFGFGG